jgi:hypothetical protein
MSRPQPSLLIVVCGVLGIATAAHAQWSVTSLHPPGLPPGSGTCGGAAHTFANGTAAGQQVGARLYNCGGPFFGGPHFACLWSGSAGTWVDLHPKAIDGSSAASATNGVNQVGSVSTDKFQHACMWSGTAESWIDLHPRDTDHSAAFDLTDTQQVGHTIARNRPRASLWSGTAESWVDLHPSDAEQSIAWGVGGAQQVGEAVIGGQSHASLWTGSAQSWVDLHPEGAVSSSARAVAGGQQVGYARFGEATRASLWLGSAASRVDLHPEGLLGSGLYDTTGNQHVGRTYHGGNLDRAGLWYGSSKSHVDLSTMAPAGFTNIDARSISSDGSVTYIAGYGVNASGRREALLWTLPAQECPPNIVNSPTSVFQVNVDDLIGVILQWGPCSGCPEDIDDDGDVDVDDLIAVILAWGPCP